MSLLATVTEDTRPTEPRQKFVGHTRLLWGVIHLDSEISFLHADAIRRPAQQPKNARVIPTGFFTEIPHVLDHDIVHPISPPVVPEDAHPIPLPIVPEDAPPDVQPSSPERAGPRFFKWFHSNTPARPTFLYRARLPFIKPPQRRDNDVMELQERTPSMADVPLAHGLPRNYSAREARMKREKEKERARQAKIAKKSKNMKNVATRSQSPIQSNSIQQSTGQYKAQPSSGPHPAVFTPPAAPANPISAPATTLATPALNAVTSQVGCWTYFLLRIGCVSVPNPSGH